MDKETRPSSQEIGFKCKTQWVKSKRMEKDKPHKQKS